MAIQIGLVPSLGSRPPNGTDRLRRAAGVGCHNAYQPVLSGHDGVVRHPSDVALSENSRGGDAAPLRLLDGHIHQTLGDDVAESPVSVNYRRRGSVLDDFESRPWHDVAALHPVYICRYLDNAVRIVSGEVCADGVAGYYFRFLLACSRPLEKFGGDVCQSVRLYGWHGVPPKVCRILSRCRPEIRRVHPPS